MLIALTLSQAWALDCTGLNTESCDAANTLADQINNDAGETIIEDDAARARFRTSAIYDEVELIRSVAAAEGCEVGGASLAGTVGGTWGSGMWTGDWDELSLGGVGTAVGDYTRTRTWTGSYSGTETGDFGTIFAVYNGSQQVAGDRDGDFLMGIWRRTTGRQGIYANVWGTCAGPIADAFGDWYDGELPEAPAPPTPQPLMNFASSFSQNGFSAGAAIDGSITNATGWAINPSQANAQQAVFELATDTPDFPSGTEATFLLQHRFFTEHLLGCFELETTTADRSQFADGAGQLGDPSIWSPVEVVTATASNGANTTISANRVVVQDLNSTVADYTVVTETADTGITGIKVIACKDDSLPLSGPGTQNINGNFVLTEIELSTRAR